MTKIPEHIKGSQEYQNLQNLDWNDANEKKYRQRIKNPQTAIRAMCIICMGGSSYEVSLCGKSNCPLHPFRLGKNPWSRNKGNPNAGFKKKED